ncbi:dioxygenase [Tabrizicola soli]|uniref:Dioxygenase n=1 Tax=Tabrizicola soli TaxID=2185115 RepID=A0ABV7DYE6_9RHOB|nr:dioxygenase [Tabrizicola soli]
MQAKPADDTVSGAFARRLGPSREARLGAAVLAVVGRAHDLVAELKPTPAEFRALVDFLTELGHASDARRQEWVLLADVTGLSTLVEEQNTPCPPGTTPATLPGPFYRDDVPELPAGANLSRDGLGEALAVSLRVTDLDGGPVPDALVEVWQANACGRYENQDPDRQPEFNLRGRLRSDAMGRLSFRSVKPCGYALPEDGRVGRLMSALGLRLERPAHIHFKVTAPGFRTLVTHVFDRDDPAIRRDALFGVRPELLAEFCRLPPGGPARHALDLTLVLVPAAEEIPR